MLQHDFHFDTSILDVYYIYTLFAIINLHQIIIVLTFNTNVKLFLFVDFLNDLLYLHEYKNIIHRNINSRNFIIMILYKLKNIIFNLNVAISKINFTNYTKKILLYLVFEIITFKKRNADEETSQSYNKKVNI